MHLIKFFKITPLSRACQSFTDFLFSILSFHLSDVQCKLLSSSSSRSIGVVLCLWNVCWHQQVLESESSGSEEDDDVGLPESACYAIVGEDEKTHRK